MAKLPVDLESADGGDDLIEAEDLMVELEETDKSLKVDVKDDEDADGDAGDAGDDGEDGDVTEDELRQYSKGVQKRINSLTSRHHTERREKENAVGERNEAARLAKQLVDENNRLKGLLNRGEHVLVGEAKGRLSSELKSIQNALTMALEAGDSQAISTAQSELARVMAQTERVNAYQPQELQPTQFVEPVSQQPETDPQAAKWKDQNRWFGRDEEMTAYAMGLHQKLVTKDYIDPNSEEYYQEINSNLRLRFPERFKDSKKKPNGKITVAPAQRSSSRKRSVTLNENQVRLAKRLGIPNELYAAEYLKENPDE